MPEGEDELTFGERLILAEEEHRERSEPQEEATEVALREELVLIERTDFSTAESFHVHESGISMPIDGPGELDSLVIMADSMDFEFWLEVDSQVVVNDSYKDLAEISSELGRISAYEADPEFVVSATDYPFQQSIDAVITPTDGSMTFDLQRAEIDVVREELVRVT